MSFLKQILSPFVEFKDQPAKEPVYEDKPAVIPSPVTPFVPAPSAVDHPLFTATGISPSAPSQAAAPRTGVTALPEHRQYFEKLIEDANAKNPFFTGADYKEFIDNKLNIDDIADEETKYRTAFNILKKSGVTKEKLLTTAQEYHNLVGRDMNAFQSAHMQNYQKETRQREGQIEKKAEEVLALSEKINALKKEINQISQELTDTKDKMDRTKNSFLLAGEYKQQEIQTEMQKIQRYF